MTQRASQLAVLVLILAVALTAPACSGGDATREADEEIAETPPEAVERFQALYDEGQTHFEARADRQEVLKAVDRWSEALAVEDDGTISDDHRAQAYQSLARAHYFLARYHGTDGGPVSAEPELAQLAMLGFEAATEAVKIEAPGFHESVERGAPFEGELADAPAQAAESLLLYAKNLHLAARAQGTSATVSADPVVDAIMELVAAEAPQLHFGAAHRYFGARSVDRAFNRSAQRSAQSFEKALNQAPDYLATRFDRAIYLATFQGDREAYEAELQAIIDSPADAAPGATAENEIVQGWARQWLAKSDDLFD